MSVQIIYFFCRIQRRKYLLKTKHDEKLTMSIFRKTNKVAKPGVHVSGHLHTKTIRLQHARRCSSTFCQSSYKKNSDFLNLLFNFPVHFPQLQVFLSMRFCENSRAFVLSSALQKQSWIFNLLQIWFENEAEGVNFLFRSRQHEPIKLVSDFRSASPRATRKIRKEHEIKRHVRRPSGLPVQLYDPQASGDTRNKHSGEKSNLVWSFGDCSYTYYFVVLYREEILCQPLTLYSTICLTILSIPWHYSLQWFSSSLKLEIISVSFSCFMCTVA